MKLAKGVGSVETGGCWMAVADYYVRGVPNWTDQPDCVDPLIRVLAIQLNDWCNDGEREALIGPHLFTPIGTFSDSLRLARLQVIVQFSMDCAAEALDDAGIEHGLRKDWGEDYVGAGSAARAVRVVRAGGVIRARAGAAHAGAIARSAAGAHAAVARSAAGAYAAGAYAAADADYSNYALAVGVAAAALAAVDRAAGKQRLLGLILDLCAMGTPTEVDCAVTKEETLRVVCGVTAGA